MKYVTRIDQEYINKLARQMPSIIFSWNQLAKATGWSPTTVKKYYDKDWYPGKYSSLVAELDSPKVGLYLFVQQIVENEAIRNLVKVGKSTDLPKRIKSYVGMNPSAQCIDTKRLDPLILDQAEKSCHQRLSWNSIRYGNTEWYICDTETYNAIKQKKFDYFF